MLAQRMPAALITIRPHLNGLVSVLSYGLSVMSVKIRYFLVEYQYTQRIELFWVHYQVELIHALLRSKILGWAE